MKMLLVITLRHRPFNAAVKDGTVGSKLSRILEATKPEAVYFTISTVNAEQCSSLICLMPRNLPALVEPWMLLFEADIKLRPCNDAG
jgi:hypothetical protein